LGVRRFFSGRRGGRARRRDWIPVEQLRGSFFLATSSLDELRAFFAASQRPRQLAVSQYDTGPVEGRCYVCDTVVGFATERDRDTGAINWRESLSCPSCGLINRWRSSVHMFELLFRPRTEDRIYITEALSPLYSVLAARFPGLTGSEFLPEAETGAEIDIHGVLVRNEDITRLTFGNRVFDYVLTFDVLEHVPDYHKALRECHRILKRGGQLMVSVPFSFAEETLVRAEVDGQGRVRHLLEPNYHGDPLQEKGVLCYYDHGMEILTHIREAGFGECFAVCFESPEWAYYHPNVLFIARKA
jgi:SAM-dependent methyltransferase